MKKNLTNNTILSIINGMDTKLGEALFNKRIPVKISYALQYNMEQLSSAYNVYSKTLNKLVQQYNVKFKDDGTFETEHPNEQGFFDTEFKNLLQASVELEIKSITYDDLEKCDSAPYDPLSPNDLGLLYWFIEE